jgi:hypothetical protein
VARRLALLVATYCYEDAGLRQLAAPGLDAEALAEVLRNPEIADFEVTILVNEPYHGWVTPSASSIITGAVTISRCCISPDMA